MTTRTVWAVSMVAAMTVSALAATPDWTEAIERGLETTIYRTSETAVLYGNRVTREGAALVVKKTGILANPARYLGSVNTKITETELSEIRHKGELEFHFPKGFLKSASLEDLRRTFDAFLEPL